MPAGTGYSGTWICHAFVVLPGSTKTWRTKPRLKGPPHAGTWRAHYPSLFRVTSQPVSCLVTSWCRRSEYFNNGCPTGVNGPTAVGKPKKKKKTHPRTQPTDVFFSAKERRDKPKNQHIGVSLVANTATLCTHTYLYLSLSLSLSLSLYIYIYKNPFFFSIAAWFTQSYEQTH